MKELKLSGTDKVAIVDDEDFERISIYRWQLTGTGQGCIKRSYSTEDWLHRSVNVSLASEIMRRPKQKFDHKDKDPLNNQKLNLRACNGSQNSHNRTKKKGCSSVYFGVCWKKDMKMWSAKVTMNEKQIHIGYFINEIDAAKAYNAKALELFREFANLNNV